MNARDEQARVVRWARNPGVREMLMEDAMAYDPDPLYFPEEELNTDLADALRDMAVSYGVPSEWNLHTDADADWAEFVARELQERGLETPVARRSSSKVVLLALGVGAALGFVAGWAVRG